MGALVAAAADAPDRPRARDLGIVVGPHAPGALNATTDVAGVRVGHATVIRGDSTRTGVTVIFPHGGNPFESRVPAAVVVGNGFGTFVGYTQSAELGNELTAALFEPAVDATVEAIYNSLLRATTAKGAFSTVEALPIEEIRTILRKYGIGR